MLTHSAGAASGTRRSALVPKICNTDMAMENKQDHPNWLKIKKTGASKQTNQIEDWLQGASMDDKYLG